MRTIDADALSAFVGDLRSTLHKEQTTFRAMTELEFNTRDYMLLNFQQTIDNAPTVEITDYDTDYQDGLEDGLNDIRPQGEWKPIDTTWGRSFYYCTACQASIDLPIDENDNPLFKFCPNCGADMRGGRE